MRLPIGGAGVVFAAVAGVLLTPAVQAAPPSPDTHKYALRPVTDGTYFYEGPRFTATIAADGTVAFHPTHWQPSSRLAEVITGKGEGRKPEDWPLPQPPYSRPTPYDDRERQLDPFTPQIPLAAPIFIDPGGHFDLTDEYARRMGADPDLQAKTAFLSDTFDFRMGLAARQQRKALGTALAQLSTTLEAIWRDPRFSPAERRQIIYLIWQETSDDAGGAQARQIIESFARRAFPPADAARFSRPGG